MIGVANGTNGLSTVEAKPAGGQPAWMTTIRDAIAKVVTPDAMEKMIRVQVNKAEAGDVKALKFLMELSAKMQPQQVNATQNVFHVHVSPAAAAALGDNPLRLKAYAVIEAMGPLTVGQIAANLGVEHRAVEEAVDHSMFGRGTGRAGETVVIKGTR